MGTNPKYSKIEARLSKTVKEKPPKNPKVPAFPQHAATTAQKLREIIDAGGEQVPLAYAALSRLCVLWTPGALVANGLAGGQFGVVVNDLVGIMSILFPDGEGMPDPL